MKVVQLNPDAPDGRHFCSLTVGKQYEDLGIECDMFRLLDDIGDTVLFDAQCFEVTDPREPEFWVSALGESKERYAYPPGWGAPGFFEAWHDGVITVHMAFEAQLRAWYPDIPPCTNPSDE